jgi:hypothetical protein
MRVSIWPVTFVALVWLAPPVRAQTLTVRIVNARSGRPLRGETVTVALLYGRGQTPPAGYPAIMNQQTDARGEARFLLPKRLPEHFSAQAQVDWSRWRCGCGILGSTRALLRRGVVGPVARTGLRKPAPPLKATPGEVLFVARPLSLFQRLLYPIMKE